MTIRQSKAYWLDLLQHSIRAFAVAMVASVTVGAAGTAGGYLPVTEVDWLGGLYIGLTGAFFTLLLGLTSAVIPGADPDSTSFFPKPKETSQAAPKPPAKSTPQPPVAPPPATPAPEPPNPPKPPKPPWSGLP